MNLKISLLTDNQVLSNSYGEVTLAETLNYKDLSPVPHGLMCEAIFGPMKDYTCRCGHHKKDLSNKGFRCSHCGVTITKSSARRERFGHIHLAKPIVHIWHFKNNPNIISCLLDLDSSTVEKIIYCTSYIVTSSSCEEFKYRDVIASGLYFRVYKQLDFIAMTGAEAIYELLSNLELSLEIKKCQDILNTSKNASIYKKTSKRLMVLNAFYNSKQLPSSLVMNNISVTPPDLRPIVTLPNGVVTASDITELYRLLMIRNERMKKLVQYNAPDILIHNEMRLLQEASDSLFYNGRNGKPVKNRKRPLHSMTDSLKGKRGRFRANLLGKRVDYSGRSVITVGPFLKLDQCGLPLDIAIELFRPFVVKNILDVYDCSIKLAQTHVEKRTAIALDALDEAMHDKVVFLNRAPTLHRLGIQAFYPVLVDGNSIRLHPLVCTAFNADFDGDQMAVHLPLSVKSQEECKDLLLSSNNILKPSDGELVCIPSQDIVLGIYYLTKIDNLPTNKVFKDFNEAMLAYENKYISLHNMIKVRVSNSNGSKIITSTLGRLIFNTVIPQNLGYVDRMKDSFSPEIEFLVDKGKLKDILQRIFEIAGTKQCVEALDKIKELGFKYSTQAAMTVSISDMDVPEEKHIMIEEAQDKVGSITKNFKRGLITDEERYKEVITVWKDTDNALTKNLLQNLDRNNNLFMMADSGARGSDKQIKQLAGMRGLMADATGRTIELPIKSSFREGLDVLEYFISAHGARKGLSDTALRTADAGYLTRRLVDVAQDMLIVADDCSPEEDIPFLEITAFMQNKEVIESLEERITDRVLAEDIYDRKGNVIAYSNALIDKFLASKIITDGSKNDKVLESIKIRTVQSCRCKGGVCAKCYGADLSNRKIVKRNTAVGIIAAQSIGEPGTQLTMRTFHTGGVAGDDITQGLPRIEEIFEARVPKKIALFAKMDGYIKDISNTEIVIENRITGECEQYKLLYGVHPLVTIGDFVCAGAILTDGSINIKEYLPYAGFIMLWNYILKEVQKVYRLQGVSIADKHIEVILKKMLMFSKITDSNYNTANDIMANHNIPEDVNCEAVVLGISTAAIYSDSFIAAASFQKTTSVLLNAAINAKVDQLNGIKENVILGNLIPSAYYTG